MKNILLACLFLFFTASTPQVQAQTTAISEVKFFLTDGADIDAHRLKDSAQVFISFKISNPKNLDRLLIRHGSVLGENNFFFRELTYQEYGNLHSFRYGNQLFPVIDGRVEMHWTVSKDVLKNAGHVVMAGKDKTGKELKLHENKVKDYIKPGTDQK